MTKKKRVPKVRIARPKGRSVELRYTDPETNKEVRLATSTADESEIQEQKKELEAKLLLGIDAKREKRPDGSPNMLWEDFRDLYSKLRLNSTNRKRSGIEATEVRLDVAERILKPRRLIDIVSWFNVKWNFRFGALAS